MIKKILMQNKKTTFLFVLTQILFAISNVYFTFSLSYIFDSELVNGKVIGIINTRILVSFILTILSFYICGYIRSKYINEINKTIKNMISNKVLNQGIKIINKKNTGRILSWFINDTYQVENILVSVPEIFQSLTAIIGSIIAIYLLHWILAIFSILLLAFNTIAPKIGEKKMHTAQERLTQANENHTEEIRDSVDCLPIFFFSNNLDMFKRKVKDSSNKRERVYKEFNISKNIVDTMITFTALFSQLFLIFLSVILTLLVDIPKGSVIGIIGLSGNLFAQVETFFDIINQFRYSEPILNKFILKEKLEKQMVDIKNVLTIELKNVYASYNKRYIINDFSFIFIKGKKYGIVGNSGSGKSTLLKIILGVLDIELGELTINGIKMDKLNKMTYYDNISYIDQTINLFNGTLRENILLNTNIDNDRLDYILDKVSLKLLIESLPLGLDTIITSNGKELSGGEKQRIAIARALVKNVDFILIDEATSQLDKETSQSIEELYTYNYI